MLYDNAKKVIEKYADVMDMVGKAYDVDGEGEAHAGLDLSMAYSVMENALRNGTTAEVKGVPEGFDWDQFAKDVECCE